MTFDSQGLTFTLDREGLELERGTAFELELDYEDLGMDAEHAPAQLGKKLSTLAGAIVVDEEGLFDFTVHREGVLVATLALACEDEALEVVGELAPSLREADLANALLAVL